MAGTLRNFALGLGLVLAVGCQNIFGDFSVASAPAEEPASVLGAECEPDAYRCSGEILETCAADRSGFVVAEACADASACNLNSRTCRPCVPGERMCRDNVLEHCDDALSWQVQDTCETAALCNVAPDRRSGTCAPPICAAGAHACEGAKLVRCSAGRDRVEAVALCATPELCDVAYANELGMMGARGECRPPACAPDAYRCDGTTLRHCAIDRTVWEGAAECDSADLCNVARGACVACEPSAVECNGAELRRCTSAGAWETLDTCDSAALCDAVVGSCHAAECHDPGALRCGNGGIPVLQRCSAELSWQDVELCATVELCNARVGQCLSPACVAGAARCLGNRLESCSPDLTRWDLVATCADGEICSPDQGCIQGTCTEGEVRCNDTSRERCVSGRYVEEERCATAILCNASSASCTAPVCPESPAFECRGSIIRKCREGRDGFIEDFRTCQTGTCDPTPALGTGLPECDACTPNAYVCDSANLMRCSSDGLVLQKVDTCPTGCLVTDGVPACGQMP